MIFRSLFSQLSMFSLIAIHFSIPFLNLLASDSGSPHLSRLETRTQNDQVTDYSQILYKPKKNHNKKQAARLKAIHFRNSKYHKKKKATNSTQGIHHVAAIPSTPTSQPKDVNQPNVGEHQFLPVRETSKTISHLDSACGSADPTSKITVNSGPNGKESFLNCGIKGNGWEPAHVEMSMLKTASFDEEPAKTTFAPCLKYRPLFDKHAATYGIPPIFLAAFAMQESSCKPDVVGDDGGAFGLMQITKDKCGDAPGGNCADPDYNVKMGAKTFADALKDANGNVLKAIGGYNGWFPGLTFNKALEAKSKGCCVCQQNLDYLHQVLNGWIQGIDPHIHRLGTVRNLDSCGDQS